MGNSAAAMEAKQEVELILMVVSDDPVSTIRRVSGLTSIAGYSLIAQSAKRGVRLESREIDSQLGPAENLRRLGLEVLQDRETYREPRDLVPVDWRGKCLRSSR